MHWEFHEGLIKISLKFISFEENAIEMIPRLLLDVLLPGKSLSILRHHVNVWLRCVIEEEISQFTNTLLQLDAFKILTSINFFVFF